MLHYFVESAKRKQGGFLMPESEENMTALVLMENGRKILMRD